MKYYNILCVAAYVFILSALSNPASAEYYEGAINRPTSSGQHINSYIEDDTGQIKHILQSSTAKGRGYNVYLPNGETKKSPYKRPAILLLHGAGRTGASLVERWRSVSDREDIILLGPHAGDAGWHLALDAQIFLPALLKESIKKYNIDPDRIYLFGHSMGGIFAATLALSQPKGFAGIGIHAGLLPENFYNLHDPESRKTPIVIINGTHDKGFPLDKVRATAKSFSGAGHDVNFYVLKGHGHWYYDIAPDINEMAWDYLKTKKLD